MSTSYRVNQLYDILHQIKKTSSHCDFALYDNEVIRDAVSSLLEIGYAAADERDNVGVSSVDISDSHIAVTFQLMSVSDKSTFFRYEFTSNYSKDSIGVRIVYISDNRTSVDIINTRIYQRERTSEYDTWENRQNINGWIRKSMYDATDIIPDDFLDYTHLYDEVDQRFQCFIDGIGLSYTARITGMPLVNLYSAIRFNVYQ